MANADKHVRWLPFVLVIIAVLFRLPGLQRVPPLLNQDEASRGYDAWCLLETGADRHGQSWPLFLESFGPGDYTAALTTYLTIPFVALLGPSATAMRLPDAICGVGTVLLLFFWLRRRAGIPTGMLAAAALAFDPWHIALSRTAHESGFTPFFFVFSMMAMEFAGLLPDSFRRDEEEGGMDSSVTKAVACSPWRRTIWGFIAGLMMGAYAWAYPATRLFAPLFCIAVLVIYARGYITFFKTGVARRVLAFAFLGLVLGTSPLWTTAIRHPEYLAARAGATLLVHQGISTMEVVVGFLTNYAANLNPRYWFVQADEMSGASIPGVGQHLIVLAPLWLIGVVRILVRFKQSRWSRLLVAWFILYPVPAAVCADWNPHPMRTVAGMILFPIIVAIGGRWLVERLATLSRPIRRTTAIAAILALLANVGYFAKAYYIRFPEVAGPGYQNGLVRAIAYVAESQRNAGYVLVTNESNQPYIYALLYEPISPKELIRSPAIICEGPKGFHQVLTVGRYLFAPSDPTNFPESGRRFRSLYEEFTARGEGFLIETERTASRGEYARVLYSSRIGGGSSSSKWNYVVHRRLPAGAESGP